MKKSYYVFFLLIAFGAVAQEIIVPSSFDENKMIVKKMDRNGNFLPVDENTLPSDETPSVPVVQPQTPKQTRRLKAVQKDLSLPTSTFGSGNGAMQLPSTFSTQTMPTEMQDIRRENTIFQECTANDKDCKEYDVDEKGQVIFK